MIMDIEKSLNMKIKELGYDISRYMLAKGLIDAEKIEVLMINECPPSREFDFIYSENEVNNENLESIKMLFGEAGKPVDSIQDLLNHGIYITTAIKIPKTEYAVSKEMITDDIPLLEHEIKLFSNLKVIMLMGDVAKKSFNMIVKKQTKKNCIPSGATYKIRSQEFYYDEIRIFPSYIMTGKNLKIEKSKVKMIADDISRMFDYLDEKGGDEQC